MIELAIKDTAKVRRSERATLNLYNAVRRGDVKAVRALILNGADPKTRAPDGAELIELAKLIGYENIIEELEVIS